jgi:hypothetical protein
MRWEPLPGKGLGLMGGSGGWLKGDSTSRFTFMITPVAGLFLLSRPGRESVFPRGSPLGKSDNYSLSDHDDALEF